MSDGSFLPLDEKAEGSDKVRKSSFIRSKWKFLLQSDGQENLGRRPWKIFFVESREEDQRGGHSKGQREMGHWSLYRPMRK